VSFEELGHDLVLASEASFELLDLLVLRVGSSFGFAAGFKSSGPVFEEDLEPVVEGVDVDLVQVAQIGDGHLLDEVLLEDDHLLRGREHPCLGHTSLPSGLLYAPYELSISD
jgi:hypothetical protein